MSAGAMRFPSRGRWLIVLLVLGPFLVIFPAALWLGWTMNPVQNFYLGTYAACSTLSGYPDAVTTVRYPEKTAPGRKRSLCFRTMRRRVRTRNSLSY